MTSDNVATWAAIPVSVAALAISILAWRAAHRAAAATERSAVADEQAAHQQRTPKFTAEIAPATEGRQWHHLTLRLDGPISLDELTVEILGSELVYSSTQHGVPLSRQGLPRDAWPFNESGNRVGLAIGETAGWEVTAVDKYVDSNQVTLRCHAKAWGDEWTVLVTVDVPGSLGPGPQFAFA